MLKESLQQGIQPIKTPRICVVLTAYNDAESIYDATRDFISQENVIKVIVVDNNCVDNTCALAMEAGAEVVRETKQGYGYACMRGLKEALLCDEANLIVLAEGDCTFTGSDIKKLLQYRDDADMVLGNRTSFRLVDDDSQQDQFMVWGNLFLAKLIQFKYWDSKFWGKCRLTDVGCTLRMIRRESLQKIIDKLYVGSHHFSPHMIMVALANKLVVVEIPVTFRKRVGKSKGAGGSKKKAIPVGLTMLWHVITYHGK
jgi:glycosyltransferase involved in cell wall biosynthesis